MTGPQQGAPADRGYDGAGSLFALGLRMTYLNPFGAPLPGERNCYVTNALVKLELGLEYQEAKEIVQTNGAGLVCVNYAAPPTLKSGSIKTMQLCTPDPIAMQFLIGGLVTYDNEGDAVGYSAPAVGVENRPNGISIEFWTRGVIVSSYARKLPFLHWVVPQAFLAPTKTMEFAANSAATPDLDGYSIEDPNWGRGPLNDYEGPTGRVWQYLREPTVPNLKPGFKTVQPQNAVDPTPGDFDTVDTTPQDLGTIITPGS